MKALDVYANFISFLKVLILKAISEFDQSNEFHIEDIFWVFTVPNICSMNRENFMHEAVMKVRVRYAYIRMYIKKMPFQMNHY